MAQDAGHERSLVGLRFLGNEKHASGGKVVVDMQGMFVMA